jgi:hypothetical protein
MLQDAVNLFDNLMDCGTSYDQSSAFCRILLLNPPEMAEQLIQWGSEVEELATLQPLLKILEKQVQHAKSPWNELQIGRLTMVVDYYKYLRERRH